MKTEFTPLTEVRWGIIGCGDVTERKSGPALQNVEGSSIEMVMRRDPDKAADYAKRHGIARWNALADELIADPRVNAVYIATPPSTHAEYALRALRAGKPVYMEKPMATSHRECQEVVALGQEMGLPVFVAYYRRMLPHFEAIRAELEAGRIGAVLSVRLQLATAPPPEDLTTPGSWRWDPAIAGGGLLWDLASHQLDLMDWWFGPATEVRGMRSVRLGLGVEDSAVAALRMASGVLLSAHWCFAASPASRCDVIEVTGTSGQIRTSCFGPGKYTIWAPGVEAAAGQEVHFQMPTSIQEPLIHQIVGELRGTPGVKSPSTGVSAARTNYVLEQLSLVP